MKAMESHFRWRLSNMPKQIDSKIYETLVGQCDAENGLLLHPRARPQVQTVSCLERETGENDRKGVGVRRQSVDDMMEGVVYLLDYVRKHMFIPGQV